MLPWNGWVAVLGFGNRQTADEWRKGLKLGERGESGPPVILPPRHHHTLSLAYR